MATAQAEAGSEVMARPNVTHLIITAHDDEGARTAALEGAAADLLLESSMTARSVEPSA